MMRNLVKVGTFLAFSVSIANASVTVDVVGPGVQRVTQRGTVGVGAGSVVSAGTMVRAADGTGAAILRYPNGCAVTLEPGQYYTVEESVNCAEAPGGGSGAGISPLAIGVGALVVTGIVAGVIASSSSPKAQNFPYISK